MKITKLSEYLSESFSEIEMHFYAFDWDDNILHMPTKILMDKKEGDSWIPVDVSTAEFTIVRNAPDYRIRNNDAGLAFSEFRDTGSRGSDAFLEDTKLAIKLNKKGQSWGAFIKCLSDASLFAIITARGHEPDSIRRAVEWIIDNELSEEEQFYMYSHCLKFSYWFDPHSSTSYPRIAKGQFSQNKLIQDYLDSCSFYGVSSKSFAQEFGAASASNPEQAKQSALDKFIERCNEYGQKIGAKSVSIGFSDDDPKNVEHIKKFFKEKSENFTPNDYELKLNVYSTVNPAVPGGERTKFNRGIKGIIDAEDVPVKESQSSYGIGMSTRGLDSSVLPFSSWNAMTKSLYPASQDNPKDDFHNNFKNKIGQVGELTKDVTKKLKKRNEKSKRVRKIRK